jgi:putative membrane protein
MPKKLFTSQQLQEIENAVKQAESTCGAEIVPVFVRQSSAYEIALWRGGLIASLFACILLVLLFLASEWLLFLPPYFWLLIPFTTGLLGALAVIVSPYFRRVLIGRNLMQSKVEEKAKAVFFDYKVTQTQQRSGILLMISFFEKKAIVLADMGIAELFPDSVWQEIVSELTQGIRKGDLVKSIINAILECGTVVAESGLRNVEDDGNELSDSVIIES